MAVLWLVNWRNEKYPLPKALQVRLIMEEKGTRRERWDIKYSGTGFLINLHPLLKLNNSITNVSFDIAVKYFMGPKVGKYLKKKAPSEWRVLWTEQ